MCHDGFCVVVKWLKCATAKAMSTAMELFVCKAKVETTGKAMVEATAKAMTNVMPQVSVGMIQSFCNVCLEFCVPAFKVCTHAGVLGCMVA